MRYYVGERPVAGCLGIRRHEAGKQSCTEEKPLIETGQRAGELERASRPRGFPNRVAQNFLGLGGDWFALARAVRGQTDHPTVARRSNPVAHRSEVKGNKVRDERGLSRARGRPSDALLLHLTAI